MKHFRSLITVEIPHLRRYARALVRNPEEADDLVQACLEKALERSAQWDASKRLRPWLFRILHNHFVSSVRRRDRENRFQSHYPETDGIPANQEYSADLERVHDAVSQLPADQRDALLLVAVSGLSYEEASFTLSVPVGTVRSRLSRARENLRVEINSGSLGNVSEEGGL
ncbi:RNA polymerase sigma-70 factor (ECF subfamily) [Natronospira proteinivora]|uniref:RNA polymerase sigma-70 factor (ECF subfamily) n=1 Tax=Natronospira proteinivora TaxID=1807133 RepID=A0ABT1G7E9_9GAMM|nr:sigma-70 family RNA polymerase sigma factor [Natronospira proteinivora]MCP1727228.1 RNA polymerase sigma-70 factor (ECF subfamily) [Natronospira proteinivora]